MSFFALGTTSEGAESFCDDDSAPRILFLSYRHDNTLKTPS